MFCANCGNKLSEGAIFCPTCGQKVGGAIARSAEAYEGSSRQEQRTKTKEDLLTVFGFFDQKEAEYDEYNRLYKEVSSPNNNSGCGMFFVYAAFAFALWVGLEILYGRITKEPKEFDSVFSIIFAVLSIATMIVIAVAANRSYKKKIDFKRARISELDQELRAHYKAYGDCPIGYEYTDPHVIKTLYKLVESGRCDTIKEALNMTEDETHKEFLRKAAAQTAASAKSAANSAAIGVGVLITRDLLRGFDSMF